MTTIAALKKNRTKAAALLTEAAKKATSKTSYETDERYWKPTLDKAGNGYATIRFLQAPDGEDNAWVQFYDHFFKGPTGRYYVAKSLTTFNQPDPVAEANSKIWNVGKAGEEKVRKDKRTRRLNFVANILVINDPANPENNGKVFLYKFGKKIFDKINEKLVPQFEGEESVNVFDFWDGANFKLKIRGTENGPNYDSSAFDAPTVIAGTDEEIEKIYKAQYSLAGEISSDKFKSYEELQKLLASVLGNSDAEFLGVDASAGAIAAAPKMRTAAPSIPDVADDGGDEDENFFKTLAS